MRRLLQSSAILQLFVLLAIAAIFNLYISISRSTRSFLIQPSDPKTKLMLRGSAGAPEGSGWWPAVPSGVEGLEQPDFWTRVEQPGRRVFLMAFRDPAATNTSDFHILSAVTTGWPLRSVERKQVKHVLTSSVVWPSDGSSQLIYHPLGLILNPIIYALPVWLLLMGAHWAFITRRTQKRKNLGLCPRCAYDLDGLPACPECGEPITRREDSACRSAP